MALDFPASPNDGDTYENYVYDSTAGVWKRLTPSGQLNGLDDVNITTPADGQALVYDSGTGDWVNETPASTIADLTDTSIATPQVGDSLVYNGASWVNAPKSDNMVINGNFIVNQRNKISETPTLASGIVIDRWNLRSGNTTTHTLTLLKNQQVGQLGKTNVLKISNFNDSAWIGQKIEIASYPFMSEKDVTVSFYAKADSPMTSLNVFLHSINDGGNHGAPSFDSSVNIGTSWGYHSYTMTIGTLANDSANGYLLLGFGQQNVDTSFYLAGVQLEIGSVATNFKHRSYATELELCKRYYQRAARNAASFYSPNVNTARFIQYYLFPEMRVTPTVTVLDNGEFSSFSTLSRLGNTNKLVQIQGTVNNIGNYGFVNAIEFDSEF